MLEDRLPCKRRTDLGERKWKTVKRSLQRNNARRREEVDGPQEEEEKHQEEEEKHQEEEEGEEVKQAWLFQLETIINKNTNQPFQILGQQFKMFSLVGKFSIIVRLNDTRTLINSLLWVQGKWHTISSGQVSQLMPQFKQRFRLNGRLQLIQVRKWPNPFRKGVEIAAPEWGGMILRQKRCLNGHLTIIVFGKIRI